MPLKEFKAISFSCYGTLIDRDSGIFAALRPMMQEGGMNLNREEVAARFSEFEAAQSAAMPQSSYEQRLAQVHLRLAKDWGVIASDEDHTLFGKSVSSWPAYAEVPAALQYLKRYFRLIMLSNADRQAISASSRRLEVMFDAVFTPQDIGSYKPDPHNFDFLAARVEKLGIPRHRLLHVASSITRDHVPASACGLASAWIDRPRDDTTVMLETSCPAHCEFRFHSLVDMVRAHQEELRS